MKTLKRIIFIIILCSSTIGFSNSKVSNETTSFSGAFVGVLGTANFAHAQSSYRYNSTAFAFSPFYAYEENQVSLGGGIDAGYGCIFNGKYYFGLTVNGIVNGGSFAKNTPLNVGGGGNPTFNLYQAYKFKNSINFYITPGFVVGDTGLIYAILGGTNASFEFEVSFPTNTPGASDLPNITQTQNKFGYIFGLGFKHPLSKLLNFFTQVTIAKYSNISLNNFTIPGNAPVFDRNNNIYVTSMNLGVEAHFAS